MELWKIQFMHTLIQYHAKNKVVTKQTICLPF